MFVMLDPPRSASDLGCWSAVVDRFTEVVGYSYFGNFFLLDPTSQQCAVLYTIGPELAPTQFVGLDAFRTRFLTHPNIIAHLGRPEDVSVLEKRLGKLDKDEVYIPCPYPFLGGNSADLDSYQKGKVWTFVDLVGQMQGVGVPEDPGIRAKTPREKPAKRPEKQGKKPPGKKGSK
jgi:Domain of unknown function (DUF1851)